ncbi:phosphoribosyltransferase family protein [Streptococcus hyointestinalis]|uniref:Competence protein ComFC n=1 Tax=Streptococcus hyointestinalis TaxID=1337 RepID=A0A380K6R2_9STRE|nr:ComF family protein [Streptococcus hyointestinalis]SUN60334.1 competence protein ComFC [Streptococcus hyointestinalis]
MSCLLCGSYYEEPLRFSDILSLKPSQHRLCTDCYQGFEKVSKSHCPTCFKSHIDKQCQDCKVWAKKGYTVHHQALFQYNDSMKAYFSSFKFEGDYLLRYAFANELKARLRFFKGYTIVPVPVSSERYQERQFNQVTALLDAAKISYQEILQKAHITKQSSLSRQERLSHDNPFSVVAGAPLPDKIVVVDDIYTTGATLADIVSLLKKNGVKQIRTFSLVR